MSSLPWSVRNKVYIIASMLILTTVVPPVAAAVVAVFGSGLGLF